MYVSTIMYYHPYCRALEQGNPSFGNPPLMNQICQEEGAAGSDHPARRGFPEGAYLQVCGSQGMEKNKVIQRPK